MKKNNEIKTNSLDCLKNKVITSLERYAIIQTGGKQYFALEGKTIAIEKIEGLSGDQIVFDEVLLIKYSNDNCKIGQPFVDKTITGTIVKQIRDRKIIVFKFKKRKKYRTKKGHRQFKTIVRIDNIV